VPVTPKCFERLLERRQRLFSVDRINAAELKHGDGLDLPSDNALGFDDVLLNDRKLRFVVHPSHVPYASRCARS
jgi:hypothetical protein